MKCLYKDKPCSRCGELIKIGDECDYDGDTKTISHPYRCIEERPSAEQFALAERLHFLPHGEALQEFWSRLRFLPATDRIDGARRSGPACPEQAALWSVRSGKEGEE